MKRLHVFIMGLMILWVSFDVAAQPPGSSAQSIRFAPPIKVMTQNLYIGADINRLFGIESLADLPEAVEETFEIILATNFPERAEALADQVARFRPHVIGLQEAVKFLRQSPGDFFRGNPNPATEPVFDYLTILLDALSARGLNYEVAAIVNNADLEVPITVGIGPGGMPLLDDIRAIDRDVILVRSDVATSNPIAHNYRDNLEVDLLDGAAFKLTRGFAAVDAELGGTTYRVVTTHLEERLEELGLEQIQAAQAAELISTLKDEALPIIVTGDFNSAPTDPLVQPYGQFVTAGYEDIWQHGPLGHHNAGLTCCQDEALLNEVSTFNRRIDHILVKSNVMFLPAHAVGPTITFVVGDRQKDKTPSGLWPSDHAGVVSRLRVPVPKP